MNQCDNCGKTHLNLIECGEDEIGKYETYECEDCGEISVFYIEEY